MEPKGKETLHNQTISDAYSRALDCRTGMLANSPSMEYLLAFRKQLHNIIRSIDDAISHHPDTLKEIRGE